MPQVRDGNFVAYKKNNGFKERLYAFRCFSGIFLVTSCYGRENQNQHQKPDEDTQHVLGNGKIQWTFVRGMMMLIIYNIRSMVVGLLSSIVNLSMVLHKLLPFFLHHLCSVVYTFKLTRTKCH